MKEKLSFAVISNISLALYFDKYLKAYFGDYEVKVNYIRYGEQSDGAQKIILQKTNYIIVWLNLEELSSGFVSLESSLFMDWTQTVCKDLWNDINGIDNQKVIWLLFEDYFDNREISLGYRYYSIADQLNLRLSNFNTNKIVYFDLKKMIAKLGTEESFDYKAKYRWNEPYSKKIFDKVAEEIYKQFLIDHNKSKKCLILDCDNVLWHGIISEDGFENIRLANTGLGKINQDFQKFVLNLYKHGVILALCSKNDLEDVEYMLRNHSGMILKEEHFVVIKANWDNKVNNILEISNELNISLDSMVFVDDLAFEIEAVNKILPEVKTILFEKKDFYKEFSCFNLDENVDFDQVKQRNETYQTNSKRRELLDRSSDYDEYLDALNMKIDIHKIEMHEMNRVSELTLRTNKLTNGRRYTVEELKEQIKLDNYELYSVNLSDRFSELGLIGAIGIEGNVVDLISLSCRAMGRNIEQIMIEFAQKKCVKKVYCVGTGKNQMFQTKLLEKFELFMDDER